LAADDTTLEIGPGLGTLTSVLAGQSKNVIAVEFDRELAEDLDKNKPDNVEVINADFLQCDLSDMPTGYKVVANIPYYITNKIVMKLLTVENKPSVIVLLVQKEVAERLAAKPGKMSILSIAAQLYSTVELGAVVLAKFFTPPPKVDSQVVILRPHDAKRGDFDEKKFFRVVKAGFSARRKKLRTAMAGGLNISVTEAENLLHTAGIDPNLRAQDLTIDNWCDIMRIYNE